MGSLKGGFICSTCGVTTFVKGQLCNPVKLDRRTACRYCGEPKENPGQLCKRIKRKVRYACVSCGRISTVRDFLCYPKAFRVRLTNQTKVETRALQICKSSGQK